MNLQHEIKKKKPFDLPEQEAFLNLIRTATALQADAERLFKEKGLSAATYNVLRILRGHGTKLPSLAIADQLITRVPDITRLVDRLEKSGLILRERCKEDRRIVHVSITPKGLALLAQLDEPVRTMHRRQLAHMSKKDLAELSRLLEQARAPLAAAGPLPPPP